MPYTDTKNVLARSYHYNQTFPPDRLTEEIPSNRAIFLSSTPAVIVVNCGFDPF